MTQHSFESAVRFARMRRLCRHVPGGSRSVRKRGWTLRNSATNLCPQAGVAAIGAKRLPPCRFSRAGPKNKQDKHCEIQKLGNHKCCYGHTDHHSPRAAQPPSGGTDGDRANDCCSKKQTNVHFHYPPRHAAPLRQTGALGGATLESVMVEIAKLTDVIGNTPRPANQRMIPAAPTRRHVHADRHGRSVAAGLRVAGSGIAGPRLSARAVAWCFDRTLVDAGQVMTGGQNARRRM